MLQACKSGKNWFEKINLEQKSRKFFGRTCNRSLLIFLSPFFVIDLMLVCAIVRIMLFTIFEEKIVWVAILSSTVGYILYSPKLWIKNNYQRTNHYSPCWTKWIWKTSFYFWFAENWYFSIKNRQIFLFLLTISTFYNQMLRRHLKVVQGVVFITIKNFRITELSICFYLLIIVKNFQIATVIENCHCRKTQMSEYNILRTQFVSSMQNGRGVELQHTHLVLFKSPRDVWKINTIGQQLGLRSQSKDWNQIATSVHYGHLFIDLTPKRVDSIRYCSNSESVPTIFTYKLEYTQIF